MNSADFFNSIIQYDLPNPESIFYTNVNQQSRPKDGQCGKQKRGLKAKMAKGRNWSDALGRELIKSPYYKVNA